MSFKITVKPKDFQGDYTFIPIFAILNQLLMCDILYYSIKTHVTAISEFAYKQST